MRNLIVSNLVFLDSESLEKCWKYDTGYGIRYDLFM